MLNQLKFIVMKTSKIKTTTRNVKQSVRRFTDEQKRGIILQIDNRPSNVPKIEMFERFGMGRGGNLYYTWKKRFGEKTISKTVNTPVNTKMNVSSTVKSGKQYHTVTLNVEVGSIMELIYFCSSIVKVPKVKSIISVE